MCNNGTFVMPGCVCTHTQNSYHEHETDARFVHGIQPRLGGSAEGVGRVRRESHVGTFDIDPILS